MLGAERLGPVFTTGPVGGALEQPDLFASAMSEGAVRGGSTITQQVTKNVFLWQGRSWVRKALETAITPAVELFWTKERIIEVYLNVAGGLRIAEPAADLAVAAALTSAVGGIPLPRETVVFGEIGLSGEVRPVGHAATRLKEAAKLGFSRAIMPARRGAAARGEDGPKPPRGMRVHAIERLDEVVSMIGSEAGPPRRQIFRSRESA